MINTLLTTTFPGELTDPALIDAWHRLTREEQEDARIRKASCTGKQGYGTKKEAKEAARKMRPYGGAPRNEYHCRFCQRWHIGASKLVGKSRSYQNSNRDKPQQRAGG